MARRRLPAPRWQTPLPPDVAGSWGPAVEAWAAAELGIRLDVWQRRSLNRALAYGPDGRLVHRVYLTSAGRQNGKTVELRSLIGWALTAADTPDWRTLLGIAHDRAQARIPYEAVREDLAPIKRRNPRGGLALTRYLGIRSDLYGRHREYTTASREARDSIRSLSVDLGAFDEIRTQRGYDTWAALEPTTRARPDPLIFGISSAGDDRSVLLRDWWERGLRIIDGAEPADGFGMTWYAAPDELAPDDPRAIIAANPAVAEGRVRLEPVAASIRTLTASKYRQETLNLWSEGGDEWLPAGVWSSRDAAQPETLAGRIVLGVEAVPSWHRATIVAAVPTDAGAWVGTVADLRPEGAGSLAPADLIAACDAAAEAWHPAAVAYSRNAAAAPHLEAWAQARDLPSVSLGSRELRSASELFRSELVGGRLTHMPDPLLAYQARVVRPSGPLEAGDWYLSIRESGGDVDAIRAAAWAAWACIAPTEPDTPDQAFL